MSRPEHRGIPTSIIRATRESDRPSYTPKSHTSERQRVAKWPARNVRIPLRGLRKICKALVINGQCGHYMTISGMRGQEQKARAMEYVLEHYDIDVIEENNKPKQWRVRFKINRVHGPGIDSIAVKSP
jgi:hypothetical protein